MTKYEYDRKSEPFQMGYNHGANGWSCSPTGRNGSAPQKGSYTYREYVIGFNVGKEDRGGN